MKKKTLFIFFLMTMLVIGFMLQNFFGLSIAIFAKQGPLHRCYGKTIGEYSVQKNGIGAEFARCFGLIHFVGE